MIRTTIIALGAPLLLSGCYAGAVGIALGLLEATGGDGTSSVNNPPLAPAVLASVRVDKDHVLLSYNLFDDDGGKLDLNVEWRPEGADTWFGATAFLGEVTLPSGEKRTGDPTTGIEVPAGTTRSATFIWDAGEDLRARLHVNSGWVRLRLTARDPTEAKSPGTSVTDPFTAGNDAPQLRCGGSSSGACLSDGLRGNIRIRFTLSDSASDAAHLRAQFSVGSEAGDAEDLNDMSLLGAQASTIFKTSPEGVEYEIVWDSASDLPKGAEGLSQPAHVRLTPLDDFEAGTPLEMRSLFIDNNSDPVIQVDVSSSPDLSFEIPVRLVVEDEESDPVTIVPQWALQSEPFPELPKDAAGLAFLEALLAAPDDAVVLGGDRSQSAEDWRRELHILSEAPVRVRGLADGSSNLPRNQLRISQLVSQGLVFLPPRTNGPRALPPPPFNGDPGVFIIGRAIRLYQEMGPLSLDFTIRAFDPRDSTVTLSGDRPDPLPEWTRYELLANRGLSRLSSAPGGLIHIFVWDSFEDLRAARVPLDSPVKVRAMAFDAEASESAPSVVRLDSGFMVHAKRLFFDVPGEQDPFPVAVASADIDSNGVDDIAVLRADGKVDLSFQSSLEDACDPCEPERSVLATTVPLPGHAPRPTSIALGDLDGDGRTDIAVADEGAENLAVVYQDAAGEFPAAPGLVIDGFGRPSHLDIGDVDGDGKNDLIVADQDPDRVAVLLLDAVRGAPPRGTLILGTGSDPGATALGDLDGDGRADIVVANVRSNTVGVYLQETAGSVGTRNAATGRYDPTLTLNTGRFPVSVALGDLDADGRLDIASADKESSGVTVQFQVETGVFRTQAILAGAQPLAVRAGDFSGDGRDDLVTADALSNTLSIFLQDDPGGLPLSPSQTLIADQYPVALATGDIDGDGGKDIVSASGQSSLAQVFLQRRPGTHRALTYAGGFTLHTDSRPVAAAIGDLDGDGRNDVAVASLGPDRLPAQVCIYLQSSSGTLPSERSMGILVDKAPGSVFIGDLSLAIGDLDGNGRSDLAVASRTQGTLGIYLDSTSALGEDAVRPSQTILSAANPTAVAIGDLDGDGLMDVAVADARPESAGGSQVNVYLQRASVAAGQLPFGTEPSARLATADGPTGLAIGDLDGDGLNEVATTCGTGRRLTLHYREPGGSLALAPRSSIDIGFDAFAVSIGDATGDGKNDILVAHLTGLVLFDRLPDTARRELAVPEGASSTGSCLIGDLDGDGRSDVLGSVASTFTDPVSAFVQGRRGEAACGGLPCFASFSIHMPRSTAPHPVALGDLNGDGREDIVIASYGNGSASVFLSR